MESNCILAKNVNIKSNPAKALQVVVAEEN